MWTSQCYGSHWHHSFNKGTFQILYAIQKKITVHLASQHRQFLQKLSKTFSSWLYQTIIFEHSVLLTNQNEYRMQIRCRDKPITLPLTSASFSKRTNQNDCNIHSPHQQADQSECLLHTLTSSASCSSGSYVFRSIKLTENFFFVASSASICAKCCRKQLTCFYILISQSKSNYVYTFASKFHFLNSETNLKMKL